MEDQVVISDHWDSGEDRFCHFVVYALENGNS